jgi:hypothetical protein
MINNECSVSLSHPATFDLFGPNKTPPFQMWVGKSCSDFVPFFLCPRRRLPSGELIPLECDEQALHYFFAQKASLPMAKLRLASDLGMKKGKPSS